MTASGSSTQTIYAPPPGPPPAMRLDPRPSLLHTSSKLDLDLLATNGWISLPLEQYPELHDAYAGLFDVSEEYFALPDDDAQKTAFAAPTGAQASEEGYSRIPGEKQILTCRTPARSPSSVRARVRGAWDAAGALTAGAMADIARSLGLPADAYAAYVAPCAAFPEQVTPTLLRMFRYDRPPAGEEPRVVAEPHKDLGLLSLVVGHSPGLDVLEPPTPLHPQGSWVSIEEPVEGGSDAPARPKLTATLMSGQVLGFLSQGRYKPGVHRVSVRPTTDSPFRFSLVFALRPARAPVHTALLESPQTGPFPPGAQLRGESMGVVFETIVKSHWNVNVHKELREEQRARFVARRVAEGAEPPPEVLAAVAAGAAGSVSADAETSQKDARNSQDAKADAEATVGATGAEDVHGSTLHSTVA